MIQILTAELSQSSVGNDVLLQLNKYKQHLSDNNNNNNSINQSQLTEILIRQRIVYLTAKAIQTNNLQLNTTNNQPSSSQSSSQLLLNEFTAFVNKVNLKVMSSTLEQMDFQEKLYLISKSIDMLYYNVIVTNVKPLQKLLQLRALTFNNLSCIYKENKCYDDALKALQVTLQIQLTLLAKNHAETYKSIISTYINKSVILSSLRLHKQAIETIKTAVDRIEKYQQRLTNEASEVKEKEQREIKRMTLVAYFNIAVEYQHLGSTEFAIKFYQITFQLAQQLSNKDVKSQSLSALKKLKPKN